VERGAHKPQFVLTELDRMHARSLVVAVVNAFPNRRRKPSRPRTQVGRIPIVGMWPIEDTGRRWFADGEADNSICGRGHYMREKRFNEG
jgi:hypothetical protein